MDATTFTPIMPSVATAAPAQHASSDDFSFDDLLDVVNPLQHLPVVSTLYRAITGDTIKTPEKIAGDTLYGGFWGLVSSLADTAFEGITGKSVGDTVLAWVEGGDDSKPVAVASNQADALPTPLSSMSRTPLPQATVPDIAAPQPASTQTAAVQTPGIGALSASLDRSGIDPDLAQRALYAYRLSTEQGEAPAFTP